MTDDILRKFSPSQTPALRSAYVDRTVVPKVTRAFERFPLLNSAVMFVAQHWSDEAHDAVHAHLVYSLHSSPDIAAYLKASIVAESSGAALDEDEEMALEWLIEGFEAAYKIGECYCSELTEPEGWDENNAAIPLFAAYCREGTDQCMPFGEAYEAYAIFRRTSGSREPAVEIVGEQIRPWLDGVAGEWDSHRRT